MPNSTEVFNLGPLVVKPKIAWKMLQCSNTRGYELLATGELESFLDGRSRKIVVASIQSYITRRLAAKDTVATSDRSSRTRSKPGGIKISRN
jgi:hypothetical protein